MPLMVTANIFYTKTFGSIKLVNLIVGELYQEVYSTGRCNLSKWATAVREDEERNRVDHDISDNIKGKPDTTRSRLRDLNVI